MTSPSPTSNNHPITPPPELVKQWVSLACEYEGDETWQDLAIQAAHWGADKELEACCEYLTRCAAWEPEDVQEMRDLRRPKPPSLKEQALKALDQADEGLSESEWQQRSDTIRRALESLPD